jgi:hypothetical protein
MGKVDIVAVGNEPFFECGGKTENLNEFYEALAQHTIDYQQQDAGASSKRRFTDVLEQHYREARLLNGASAGGNLDPAKACADPQATKTFTSLHDAWAKPGITLPPQSKVTVTVTVNRITPNGDTATVTDTGISLDGHTLNALMLIGSTNAQGFGVTWTMQQQKGRWFISSMDLGN